MRTGMEYRALFWSAVLVALVLPCYSVPCAAQESRDHVVIILDASGSMASTMGSRRIEKMTAAKAALKEVLTKMPESTYVGLLVFSGKNVPDRWLYPLGTRDNAALVTAIDRPTPSGNTPLGEYIKIGADRLLEERTKQFGYGSYRLLIVTDGEATDGELTAKYTPDILARGITMDVIGVDMKKNHMLATKVNSYRRADDPESLKKALTEILAEVPAAGGDTAGDAAFATLEPLPAELCTAILGALSAQNNVPIGEKPPVKAPDKEVASHPAEAPQTAAPVTAPTPQVPPGAPQNNPAPPGDQNSSGKTIVVIFIAVLVLLAAKNFKGKRQ